MQTLTCTLYDSTYYAVGSTGRTTRGPTLHTSRTRLGNHSARLTLCVARAHMIPAVHRGWWWVTKTAARRKAATRRENGDGELGLERAPRGGPILALERQCVAASPVVWRYTHGSEISTRIQCMVILPSPLSNPGPTRTHRTCHHHAIRGASTCRYTATTIRLTGDVSL